MPEFANSLNNAALDGATTIVDNGEFRLLTTSGTVLFTFPLAANSFGAAASSQAAQAATSTATAEATGAIGRYQWRDSADNVVIDRKNLSYTITAANQNATNNTFTITGHELEDGQKVKTSGTQPTMSPAIAAGDVLYVRDVGTDLIQLSKTEGGPPLDMSSVAANDTFTIQLWPPAVAAMQSLSETVADADQSTADNDFTITAHTFNTNDLVQLSGTMPTTSPQIYAGERYYAIDNGADSVQLSLTSGGGAIGISATSGDDTFTITRVSEARLTIDKADLNVTSGSTILAIPTNGILWTMRNDT